MAANAHSSVEDTADQWTQQSEGFRGKQFPVEPQVSGVE